MATTLTTQNKQSLKRLLKTGRWNNESEIMRYGLHLVVPFLSDVLGGTPDTYQPAGLRRGTTT